jgi:hypothetical protein
MKKPSRLEGSPLKVGVAQEPTHEQAASTEKALSDFIRSSGWLRLSDGYTPPREMNSFSPSHAASLPPIAVFGAGVCSQPTADI